MTVTFKGKLPTTTLPQQPVLTDWCMWLNRDEHYSKKLKATEDFV
jgi:hypothetical protein